MKNNEIDNLNFEGWPVKGEILVELGRISALWNRLERILNMSIGSLAGYDSKLDPSTMIVLSHAGFTQRLDMFATFCGILSVNHQKLSGYKPVLSKLRAAQKERNKYMHSVIYQRDDKAEAYIQDISARGEIKIRDEKLKLSDLRRASIVIDEARTDLHNLICNQNKNPEWQDCNV